MFTAAIGLRALLYALATYHLIVGVLALASPRATAGVARGLYGVKLEAAPQLAYVVRMLGLYALALGGLLVLAGLDPPAHAPVIAATVFLLLARAVCRLAWARTLTHAFGVTPARNLAHVAVLLVEAVLLMWWFPM